MHAPSLLLLFDCCMTLEVVGLRRIAWRFFLLGGPLPFIKSSSVAYLPKAWHRPKSANQSAETTPLILGMARCINQVAFTVTCFSPLQATAHRRLYALPLQEAKIMPVLESVWPDRQFRDPKMMPWLHAPQC